MISVLNPSRRPDKVSLDFLSELNTPEEKLPHSRNLSESPITTPQGAEEPSYPALKRVRDHFVDDTAELIAALEDGLQEAFRIELAETPTGWLGRLKKRVLDTFKTFLVGFAGKVDTPAGFAGQEEDDGLLQKYWLQGYAVGAKRGERFIRNDPAGQTHLSVRRDDPTVKAYLREAFKRLSDGSRVRFGKDLDVLSDLILQGLSDGRSPADVLAEAKLKLDKYETYVLRRIINTEMAFASTYGTLDEWDAAGVNHVVFKAGPYACAICRTHDGNRIPVGEGKPGKNLPPLHPHCYCWIEAEAGDGTVLTEAVILFNPYHDKQGRFAKGSGGVSGGFTPKSADEAEEELDAQFPTEFFREQLPDATNSELGSYLNQGHLRINDFLRNPANEGKQGNDLPFETRMLDRAFEHPNAVLNSDIAVHRATYGHVFEGMPKNLKGRLLKDEGYVSTALRKERFGGESMDAQITIHLPKGTRALYVDNHDKAHGESEVLLNRGQVFKVLSDRTKDGKRHLTMEVLL